MSDNFLLAIPVIFGALLFTYPLLVFRHIFLLDDERANRGTWFTLFVLCTFFYAGYVLEIITIFIKDPLTNDDLVIASYLLAGSIFIVIVARIFHKRVASLDQLVHERTTELEQIFTRSIAAEKEAQKLKDHFIFVAAHELRTPVTAMRWSLEMINESEPRASKSGDVREMLDTLGAAVRNLTELVNDLLDTSRLEYGTVKIKPAPCVLNQVIERVISPLAPMVKKEGVSLIFVPKFTDTHEINADARRLGEVLSNLISNGIKYTLSGGKVEIQTTQKKHEILFSISDTGIGLDLEDMDKLFKKFSRPDNHPNKEIQSTGLGLYIAKSIVDRWGGHIWAESPGRGKGSTFFFTLPI